MGPAHGIRCRGEKLAQIPWFLGRWNHIQTNTPFTVVSTLKVIKRFRKGSLRAFEISIYERRFWVNLSRIILYQTSYQLGLSTLQLDKKHLQKHHCTFRCDREPSRIPAQTHNIWATRAEIKLENLFLLFKHGSLWVHLSKMCCYSETEHLTVTILNSNVCTLLLRNI